MLLPNGSMATSAHSSWRAGLDEGVGSRFVGTSRCTRLLRVDLRSCEDFCDKFGSAFVDLVVVGIFARLPLFKCNMRSVQAVLLEAATHRYAHACAQRLNCSASSRPDRDEDLTFQVTLSHCSRVVTHCHSLRRFSPKRKTNFAACKSEFFF
jgi:hypothetical protein